MLTLKRAVASFATTILAATVFMSSALAYTDLPVNAAKFQLFSGGSPVDNFFAPDNGQFDKLILKVQDSNSYQLQNNPNWVNANMPVPISVGGRARVGNGQCVDFVKHMTGNFASSSNWLKGDHVSEYWDPNALVGKVIATFNSSGNYDNSHVAIVISAWKRSGSNTVTDVWVVDANFVPDHGLTVSKHALSTTGSGYVGNLKNYYIVKMN